MNVNVIKLSLPQCFCRRVSVPLSYRLQYLYLGIIFQDSFRFRRLWCRIPSLCVSAAPVVRQSVISERPWGGGSGFCGAHCLLSIYALGFCRFLVLFWPAAQPPSLSAQPPVSPGELTHSVNNPLYSSPDLLCCSFPFGYIFCQYNI